MWTRSSSSTTASHIQNTGDRFRFRRCSRRYAAFVDLWDRGLRAREEGRSGPFVHKRKEKPVEAKKDASDRILHVTAFKNPVQEEDKLHDLYESLVEARRSIGEDALPFHKFADLVKNSGQEAAGERQPRGGVPGGGEGRKGELYGAGDEGDERVNRGAGRPRGCGRPASGEVS